MLVALFLARSAPPLVAAATPVPLSVIPVLTIWSLSVPAKNWVMVSALARVKSVAPSVNAVYFTISDLFSTLLD